MVCLMTGISTQDGTDLAQETRCPDPAAMVIHQHRADRQRVKQRESLLHYWRLL
jgi:hypothetical protein